MSLLSNAHVGLTDRIIEVSGYHTSYKRRRSSNENTEEQTRLIDGRSGIYEPDQQTKTVCIYVYISHFLSAWGDRMWQFGVGLFLVIIAPDSLLLTAVYGFVNGAAILLFGPMVGDWVDRTARLSAARISLIVQNLSIAVCAVVIYFVIYFKTEIEEEWPAKWLLNICFGIIILIAVIAQLASTGNTIAVEKDWIVEICGDDTDLLARTSAILKSIDLVTNIVAPIATGQIMAYGSTEIGALFIGGWNVVSVFVEYYLLWKVYNVVPALRARKDFCRIDEDNENGSSKRNKCAGCLYGLFESFIILFRGGKTYMAYDVAFAGLSLAAVYMTVLGFDNITVGFAYTQGINESVMGGLMAAGALVGIFGTFIYPWMRKRIGIKKTGTFGLSFQILFLCLCVGSVWAPGSPFDLNFADKSGGGIKLANESHDSNIFFTAHPVSNTTDVGDTINENGEIKFSNISVENSNSSYFYTAHPSLNTTDIDGALGKIGGSFVDSYLSISLLMAGIIGARCGLWITDLTITQLFLETVEEKERGIVLGVQTALNQLMDMIKFIMVIVAPQPELFGLLVLISFAFVCMGWILYAKYVFGTNHCLKNNNSFLAI